MIEMLGFLNQFFAFFANPLVLAVAFGIVLIFVALFMYQDMLKKAYKVLYFSEAERVAEELEITNVSPRQLKTKDNKRFIRNSVAYTLRRGAKTIILWLGKVGTAYTWQAEQNKKGDDGKPKMKLIGTLLDGLVSCLGEEVLEELTVEAKERLIASQIYVSVELEEGATPNNLPALSEQDINTEANNNMAQLIGLRIRSAMNKTDFTRDLAIAGAGGLAVLLAQGLGFIPAFTNAALALLVVI